MRPRLVRLAFGGLDYLPTPAKHFINRRIDTRFLVGAFTITVRGRPVARVVPPGEPGRPRVDVDRETVRRLLALPVDEQLAADLEAAEAPLDDPWAAG